MRDKKLYMINGHKISDIRPEQLEKHNVTIENCQDCDTKIYITEQKREIREMAVKQDDETKTLCWSCATEFVKREQEKISEIALANV